MTGTGTAQGNPAGAAAAQLAAVVQARTGWLTATAGALRRRPFVDAAWLVGSLGAGHADPYSDIDLVVAVNPATPPAVFADPVGGLHLPGPVLYTRPKPRNAPAAGGYLTACVELATLPVPVDLYLWPTATAAVPAAARILFARTDPPRTDLGFMPLLDRHRTTDTTGADPDHPATTLLLVQLAAKYLARGDRPRYAAITSRLDLPDTIEIPTLRQALHRLDRTAHPQTRAAVAATDRLLNLVAAVTDQSRPANRTP